MSEINSSETSGATPDFELYEPDHLPADYYEGIHDLVLAAHTTAIPERADYFSIVYNLSDTGAFIRSLKAPRLSDFRSARWSTVWLPRLVVATRDDEVVGFGQAADGTSGLGRTLKMFSSYSRGLYLRNVVAKPGNESAAIGRHIVDSLLTQSGDYHVSANRKARITLHAGNIASRELFTNMGFEAKAEPKPGGWPLELVDYSAKVEDIRTGI